MKLENKQSFRHASLSRLPLPVCLQHPILFNSRKSANVIYQLLFKTKHLQHAYLHLKQTTESQHAVCCLKCINKGIESKVFKINNSYKTATQRVVTVEGYCVCSYVGKFVYTSLDVSNINIISFVKTLLLTRRQKK